MIAAEIDYAPLAQEAHRIWIDKQCKKGYCPDTSYFDYVFANHEAERRGVSREQVVYEFYKESDVRLGENLFCMCDRVYSGFALPCPLHPAI
jgi:hypothetical protein